MAQLLQYNCYTKYREGTATYRHSKDREAPCAVFMGMSLYATRGSVSVHLARQFQRRRYFRYRPIRSKNCLWWPCLLTNRDEMSNPHRGHSIDTSCHAQVNLTKHFQRRRFVLNRPIRKKNCLWRAMFGNGT
jgi:hypothetical protein